ncbi:ATP-binding protein [Actinokineospora fastidiosa]|uniref:ATP-binding protein n=1 Tax=Actinokineospora fastidiosa TaxID=1816 RepID=UPI001670270F|nr:tetratricopeptide repeat protein [Actinokineospora fastidiosa]
MPEPGVRNEVVGSVIGPVVQTGSIHNLVLTHDHLPVPRQLPMAVPDLVGRSEQVAKLDALFATAGGRDGRTMVISAVEGLPGVGKTALALCWAHQVQAAFPDGTLYTDLRGYGPGRPARPGEVLDGFLRALGTRPEQIPTTVEARAGLYRSLLAERNVLVVLDNANSAGQVRPLLPGSPGSLVLVTSRDSLTGLVSGQHAHRLTLAPLTPTEAAELISLAIGRHRAVAEAPAVAELAGLCGLLPVALRIAGSRIAGRPHLRVADVVDEMRVDRLGVLRTPTDEASDVSAVFGWSYRRLTAEQAAMFRGLGLHPGPGISLHAAAAIGGVSTGQARRLLDDLAAVNLVEQRARDRYELHDLLREYARDRARHDDPPGARDEAIGRVLSWYARMAAMADRLLYPAYVRWRAHPGNTSVELIPLADRGAATAWLTMERQNLMAVVRHASAHERDVLVLSLVHAVETFFYHHAYWDELFEMLSLGIAAAGRTGDPASHAWFLTRSGWARLQRSGWQDALGDLLGALALAREVGDPYLEAYARNDLGMVSLRRNRFADALDYLLPAVSLSRGTDTGRQEAFVHCNVSSALMGLGRHRQALSHAEHSLRLRRQADDREGEVFTLNQLARVRSCLGDHLGAISACEDALAISADYAYLPDIAATLDTLGTAQRSLGDVRSARAHWSEALRIYDSFCDYRATDLRDRLADLPTEDE